MNLSTNFDDWAVMDFFVSMLIVGIGIALLATGLFTSYFGAGKSQKIGFGLLFSGVAILVIVYALTFDTGLGVTEQFNEKELFFQIGLFKQALASGVAALAGMMVGMFVILFVLMKVDTVDDLEDLDLEDLEDLDLDEELKKLEEELNEGDSDEPADEEEAQEEKE